MSAVFLTSFWKDNVQHWRFLDGYAHLVHALFEALPPTSIVLDDYTRFLQRYVYGRPLEVKRDAHIREAVLSILDCLVEAGSSAAFRMRDDFVTPAA